MAGCFIGKCMLMRNRYLLVAYDTVSFVTMESAVAKTMSRYVIKVSSDSVSIFN